MQMRGKSDIELRNQFIVSAITIGKEFFEVYDADSPVTDVKLLNIYFDREY